MNHSPAQPFDRSDLRRRWPAGMSHGTGARTTCTH
jgi:hypothetical protein